MDLCRQYNAGHTNVWQVLYDLVNECRKAACKRGRPYIKMTYYVYEERYHL
jgi:hypothetical protein